MAVIERSPQPKPKSKRTSPAPRSSARSSSVPSEVSDTIKALEARIADLEAKGRPQDAEQIAALEKRLADLTAPPVKPDEPPAQQGGDWWPW